MLNEFFLTTADENAWSQHLPVQRSVFGSIGFARVCERFRGCSARLYVQQSADASIVHPMLLRPLSSLPFATEVSAQWDATTPEFTGPLRSGNVTAILEEAHHRRTELMRREGIVSEFAHLHPWNTATEVLGPGVAYNRDIIWMDVQVPLHQQFRQQFDHSCRKNIQKATRERVHVFAGDDDALLAEFFRIYTQTMERNHALGRYAFSLDYFRSVRDNLGSNARFAFAEHSNRIIATTLYLHDDEDVYSYLGGADAEFNHLRPTNLVIWETLSWAQQSRKKRVVLGGGYKPDDGIARFKATFSKLRQPFSIYKAIHLEQDYSRLDQSSREYFGLHREQLDYFPSYRYAVAAS